jgi:hypothetical protein
MGIPTLRTVLQGLAFAWVAPALAAGGLLAAGPGTLSEMFVNRSEEEVLLFALRLDQSALSSTFPGFPAKDGVLVPLGELCRLLDLAIDVDPTRGQAQGFFIGEKRRFSLQVLAGTVVVEGRSLPLDLSRVELHADDIYVDTRLIAAWLPLDFQIISRSATITVSPREPLPIQARWQRERMTSRFRPIEGPKSFPRSPDPYRTIEVPMVDETLRLSAQTARAADRHVRAQSTTFATGDFLGLSSSLYAILDTRDGLSEFRMTMGRRDPHAGLLGPLKATEFAFGEVLDPGLNLLTLPMTGTGALLTNYPLQRENAFDRHSFQGNLPPGWQVELYRNQALLGFQASRPDGLYEFLNVPLYYGWNDFRLVFYGPQGQRREEVSRFDVSESQTPEGVFQYRVVSADPRQAGRRGQLEGRYGISRQVAAGFSVSDLDLDGRHHSYTGASLQGFWKPLSATLTAISDQLGGTAAELGLRSRIGSTSLTAKYADLQNGFLSEVFRPIYGPVQSRSSLETSTLLPSLARSLVTLDLGASRDRLVAGGSINRLYNRISTSFFGYFLSNEITLTEGLGTAMPLPASTTGDFLVSKFFRNFSLRGQANYQLDGARRLNALSAFLETPVFAPFNLRTGFTHSVVSGDTLVQMGAYKTQGAYALSAELSYSTRSRLSLDLTLRVGLAREPRSGRTYAQAQGIASHGAISARAFLDTNGNGVLDQEEKPVQGVGFLANGASQPTTTDARGVAFLANLSGDLDANLSVNSSTLEDPLMRPGSPGLRITPRQGHVVQVDVPLVLFGEITGTAYLQRDNDSLELPGLLLELVDAQGKSMKVTRTAFDGFYTISDIPPGAYQLRAPDSELQRRGLSKPWPKAVVVTPEGTVVDGLDLVFILDRSTPPPPQQDARKGERP